VEALLVDESDMGGNVAEYLGLPFVSIAFFPPLVRNDRIPPFCFGWSGGQQRWRRLRNLSGFIFLSRVAHPIFSVVNEHRRAWGLKPLRFATDGLSPLAQVTQLPEVLEFPCVNRPSLLHYTGPFVDARQRPKVDFPWEKLDGRPLVYASMGTLQNGSDHIFRVIAEACAGTEAQLVLSLGGGFAPQQLGLLPGNPVVVSYAPQLELLKQASAVITHAGLNTTLESLAEGVPLVCIPISNDQPGVAARVAACGAGVVVPHSKLNVQRLRSAVQAVLQQTRYRAAARDIQHAMQQVDGLGRAVDVIEEALKIAAPSHV
jgi:UDP:flavonoid glycosyltransferase YjiC (YdhE family)